MSTLRPIGSLDVTSEAAGGSPGMEGKPEEPRRRSVHFDAKPSTVVHVVHQPSMDSLDDNADDEAEEETEEDLPSRLVVDLTQPKYMRRKSAPVAAIVKMDPALAAKYHSVELSGTLKALDPELRKSLTKLKCTNIEDPEKDLDVVKNKLVGRDELEIYRQKQMEKAKTIACELAMANGEQ